MRVPLACAALAYEEFPMGDFQPIPDNPAIPLLGLSGWNQAKLTQSGGPYVRGSRFVDIYAMPIEDGRWSFTEEEARLNEGYRETFGWRSPPWRHRPSTWACTSRRLSGRYLRTPRPQMCGTRSPVTR